MPKAKPKNISEPVEIPAAEAKPTLQEFLRSVGIITGKDLKDSQSKRLCFSTNALGLDLALGCIDPITGLPGLVQRSITECVGPNQTYKTGTMEQLVLSVQRRDPNYIAAIICAEEVNTKRMEGIGIDLSRVICLHVFHEDLDEQYRRADDAIRQALYLVKNHPEVQMIGLDSIKAMCLGSQLLKVEKAEDKKEEAKSITKQIVAVRAILMNTFIRNFRAQNNSNAFLFMTNQVSVQKIQAVIENNGRPGFQTFNPSFYEPWDIQVESSGGYGIRHDADFRIETSSQPWFYKTKEDKLIFHPIMHTPVGRGLEINWRVFKNKQPNPTNYRKVQARFDFEKMKFDRAQEILSYAPYIGLIEQAGAWYKFDPEDESARAQGYENALAYLDTHPDLCHKLEAAMIPRRDEIFDLTPVLKKGAH